MQHFKSSALLAENLGFDWMLESSMSDHGYSLSKAYNAAVVSKYAGDRGLPLPVCSTSRRISDSELSDMAIRSCSGDPKEVSIVGQELRNRFEGCRTVVHQPVVCLPLQAR